MNNLEKQIKKLGFLNPTLIQKEAYKTINNKESAIFISPTGTGKTHAYLIPIIENLKEDNTLEALIIVPTNELVIQVGKMIKEMGFLDYKTFSTLEDISRQVKSLNHKQPKIAVITPGRLHDLVVNENALFAFQVSSLVLDEADMLFDADFMGQLEVVLSQIKGETYIFTATLKDNLLRWISKYFKMIKKIDLSKEIELDIDHHLIYHKGTKEQRLLDLMEVINPYLCFIFVSKNEDIDTLFEILFDKGYNITKLSSKMPLRKRKMIVDEIHALKYQYVLSSDIASRGMDFKGISHIINYDFPYKTEFYIHRSGRTGRMNMHGNVYLFYEDKDSRKIEQLRKNGINFKEYTIKNKELVSKERKQKGLTENEIAVIRSVKKPTKVKPNYKKKNKAKIKKALNKVRYGKGNKK